MYTVSSNCVIERLMAAVRPSVLVGPCYPALLSYVDVDVALLGK